MKKVAVSVLLALTVATTAHSQVTSNVLYRVFRIRHDGAASSAFTVDYLGKQYLVTARHSVHGLGSQGQIEIWREGNWKPLDVAAIYPSNAQVDAVALLPKQPLSVNYPLAPSMDGLQIAQQVYFLGYPSGLATVGTIPAPPGFGEFAFVKSGIVSAMDSRDKSAMIIYVDGHNNPGFSGGPIVFRPGGSGEFRVGGVVQGYRNEALPVLKRKDLGNPRASAHQDLYTRTNSGIVVGYSIKHITDAIENAAKSSP